VAYWLVKTEPSSYSFDDLLRDRKTVWNGVRNASALIHMRAMKKSDLAIVYHTGGERAAVGIAQIASDPYPDPKADDPRIVAFDLKAREKLQKPVTLEVIKADPVLAGWDLLRISRLSVMPVAPAMWKRIEQLSKGQS
jgi:predicted RNA-binding protein with PUA-like domain